MFGLDEQFSERQGTVCLYIASSVWDGGGDGGAAHGGGIGGGAGGGGGSDGVTGAQHHTQFFTWVLGI